MDLRNIDATANRPDGDRVIDAPFVFVDLEKYMVQLKKEEAWHKSDRNSITVYKSNSATIVLTSLHKDASIEENLVDGWLTLQVMDGQVDVIVEGNIMTLHTHQLLALHPGMLHTIRAKKESTILLTNRT